MRRMAMVVVAVAATAACDRTSDVRPWLGVVEAVESPAPPGSRYPNLAGGGDSPVVLSWLHSGPGQVYSLNFAQWSDRGLGRTKSWSAARQVASGADWFVNWADFPSVVPVGERIWAAHWLQQKPGDVYAYDVRIAISPDAGRRWSAALTPHDDGTPTEHGFVSLLGRGGHVRAIWLDGRRTRGEHDHAPAEDGTSGAMTLRTVDVDASGRRVGADRELDARVCDCCQTDAVAVGSDILVVYRDRGEQEVRDIRALRIDAGGNVTSSAVHADRWRIAACPVNGPAVAAQGARVAVAWFTAPDVPRVRVAFSSDGGRSFSPPVEVASGRVAGRVDVVFTARGRAIVSWLTEGATGAHLVAQPFTERGAAGALATIARIGSNRAAGFPQMVRAGSGLVFAWTDSGEPTHVRTAFAPLL